MTHGCCCDCFICKLGKTLGLIQGCGDDCCQVAPKKVAKKTTKKVVKKSKSKAKKK